MAQWQTGEVMTNGVRINYTRTGGDKPPLVLSHASTDYGRFWTPVARTLEPDYDVIMYDQRGHGRWTSNHPERWGIRGAQPL